MNIGISGIFARGEDSVCVCFEIVSDDGAHKESEKFLISAAQLAGLGLSKGACDEALYDRVAREAQLYEAMCRAMRSLEYGACSAKTLRLKLIRAGFERDIAAETVERLSENGLISDVETACREAERSLKKLWGRRRIEAELYKKGYGADSVREALRYIDRVGADYVANCRLLIRKKLRVDDPDPAELKKLYAALVRYGYTSGEIREALGTLF